MDYKEKYENGVECIQEILSGGADLIRTSTLRKRLQPFFPELKENENNDERIRKAILQFFELQDDNTTYFLVPKKDILAWLEKQGKQKKVSIWKHWKNGIAGNGEGRQVYLIKTGNTYTLSSCLGFECDYIELSELDNLMLEKQGEKKPAIPKVWKYKKDHIPLLKDSLILNKYGCVGKSPSGAIVSDVWVLDYDELAKLPKEELEKQKD